MHKARILAAVFTLSVLVVGCSSKGNPNAPASLKGKVTYKGQAVTGGTLTFHSDAGIVGNYPINPDGTYGAPELPIGDLTVTVDTESLNPDKKAPEYKGGSGNMPKMGGMYGMKGGPQGGNNNQSKTPAKSSTPDDAPKGSGVYVKIPAKFSKKETSSLKVTLVKGSNEKDFELTD